MSAPLTGAPAGASGELEPLVERVRTAALSMQRKSWEQGVLAQAFLEEGRDDLVVALARASMIYLSKDGVPAALEGAPVDPLMAGEAMARAARLTGDPALHQAVEQSLAYILTRAPRAADGTIFHTSETVWSDSFHTTPPFLASTGHPTEALGQIEGHWRRLWNPRKRLLAHIWDEKAQRLTDPSAWGGGNGWAAAGLMRVIRAWPDDRATAKARLASNLRQLIDGCLAHQRTDGLFHNVVDDPDSFVETNLAQMLAYSIYESVRGGWLPADYLPAAGRMRSAARAKVDRDGFVRGVAGAPTFDRAGISPEGQAFFLMMEAAARKLAAAVPPQ
ncbi:MAG TPA: glycoside hydrolase family 88 protein [Opitutaceae bacterium]|nr:glycoside hydrolase family 88 protein [Opitutaceae bacterium]